jgi:hypothetical protein
MKIIVILREPITRAYSLYNHARRHGKSGVPDTFAAAVRDEAQVRRPRAPPSVFRPHLKTAVELMVEEMFPLTRFLNNAQALMFCREQDEGRVLEDGAVSSSYRAIVVLPQCQPAVRQPQNCSPLAARQVYNETYDYELYYRCIAEEEARLKNRGHYMLLLQV